MYISSSETASTKIELFESNKVLRTKLSTTKYHPDDDDDDDDDDDVMSGSYFDGPGSAGSRYKMRILLSRIYESTTFTAAAVRARD